MGINGVLKAVGVVMDGWVAGVVVAAVVVDVRVLAAAAADEDGRGDAMVAAPMDGRTRPAAGGDAGEGGGGGPEGFQIIIIYH